MRTVLFFLALNLSAVCLDAQPHSTPAAGLLRQIVDWQETRGRLLAKESVCLQTDRDWYLPGDTLWLSGQLLVNGLPFPYSQVLYLDVCDSSGRVLLKRILPADSLGAAAASIVLPRQWKPAWYALHASTQWMRNASGKQGYELFFSIRDPSQPLSPVSVPEAARAPARFSLYPEGGRWLAGLQNRAAVHSNDPEHELAGFVLDDGGDTLARYQTDKTGWGSFSVVLPVRGGLSALSFVDGVSAGRTEILPEPFMQPRMQTAWSAGKLYFKVEFPVQTTPPPEWLVVARMNGLVVSAFPFLSEKGQTLFTGYFTADSLPEGAIILSALDGNGYWLTGRSVFHPGHTHPVKVMADTLSLEAGGYNAWRISFPDSLAGNYSIQVTDAELDETAAPNMTLGALKIFSALGGLVPDQAGSPPLQNASAMDAWMMSVSPDSAYWRALWKDEVRPAFYPETGLSLSGRLVDQKLRPASHMPVSFMIEEADSSSFFLSDSTDAEGHIQLQGLAFVDSARFFWKIPGKSQKSGADYRFIVDTGYYDTLSLHPLNWPVMQHRDAIPYREGEAFIRVRNQDAFGVPELDTVLVTAHIPRREELLDKEYAGGGLFGGRLGFVDAFDIQNEPSSSLNIISWLAGRIANIRITGPSWGPTLTWMRGFGTGGPAPVIFFLNEVRMDDPGLVASLNMDEIAYVKVFKPPFSNVLTNTYSVVVAIYTRKGDDRPNRDKSGMKYFMRPGFTAYSGPGQVAATYDAGRIRLYWDPLVLPVNGEARIRFFNNGFSRRLKIRVRGISQNGEVTDYSAIIQ